MKTQDGDQIIINIVGHDPNGTINATVMRYVRVGVQTMGIKDWPKLHFALSETVWQRSDETAKEQKATREIGGGMENDSDILQTIIDFLNCGESPTAMIATRSNIVSIIETLAKKYREMEERLDTIGQYCVGRS